MFALVDVLLAYAGINNNIARYCRSRIGCLSDLNLSQKGFSNVASCGTKERNGYCVEGIDTGVSCSRELRTQLINIKCR